ncbi:GPN-loop GTPase 3 [Sciurus carolinensis]|uniref:GPN-loop GTPase 3 n=5 Tax=Euarchontoglires TaxID=314146 RepID=A0AA41TD03_SCICA|nr:GPN-loop GTPase 3 [Sciurus carolinensis]
MPRYAQLVMGPAGSGKVRREKWLVGGKGIREVMERSVARILIDESVGLALLDPAPKGVENPVGVEGGTTLPLTLTPHTLTLQSTYCATMVQHCEALNRSVQVVNLDPAAEHFNYPVMADIRELIEVDDVMEDDSLRFGPNGGLVFCMEYFANNFDWLENCLGHVEDDYILFDCPGQIELYTHLPVMKQLVQQLEQWEFRVCGVFLVDSQFMVESFKFISGILAALSAMISLEIPQVNIMTKMDLLSKKAKKEIEKFLDPDMYSFLKDSTSDLRSKKFKKLTKAICGLIDDYSMVRFLPYDQSDEESMNIVLQHIDFAIQYGEDLEFKEPKAYHSSLMDPDTKLIGNMALLPIRSQFKGPAPRETKDTDIVDEAIYYFKANVFFKNYEIKNEADRTLIYITLYISECLKKLQKCNSKSQGEKEMYTLGITNFPIPGEPGFPLNAIYAKPANKQEDGKNTISVLCLCGTKRFSPSDVLPSSSFCFSCYID